MKKQFLNPFRNALVVLMSSALLFSCSQTESFETTDLSEAQSRIPVSFKSINPNARVGKGYDACGTPLTRKLLAGQKIPVGEVTVFNDDTDFYVTVSIEKGEGFDDGDWFLQKVQIYAGQTTVDFVTKGKNKIVNPAPGKFDINEVTPIDFNVADQEFTYKLAISDELRGFGEFDVAVHAEVVRVTDIDYENNTATEVQKEGAWAEGKAFNSDGKGNWAMFMSYSIQDCINECTGAWFRPVSVTGNDETFNESFDFDEFDLMEGANVVGKVSYIRAKREGKDDEGKDFKERDITVTFEITKAGYSFDEFEAIYNASSEFTGLTKDNFTKFKTTSTGGTFVFEDVENGRFYLGFYAKITGLCKIN